MKTLERTYLLRDHDVVIERPQFMFMRVAVALHGTDLDRVLETYNLLSTKRFVHASPTLFHAGTPDAQLSSCFLMPLLNQNIEEAYKTLSYCATISQHAGGIGLNATDVIARGYVPLSASAVL